MQKKRMRKFSAVILAGALLVGGTFTAFGSAMAADEAPQAAMAQKKADTVYKGKITGFSKKAKSITIEVGKDDKAKTMMVKFDDNTKGLEFAEVGEAAIINYELSGKDKLATVIKPKLATLPEGVTEMQPEELLSLVALGTEEGKYLLVDSRPGKPFSLGHLPGAVSIPVEKLEAEGASLLPADKDLPLIFYCGGPT